jgi:glycosyltransferase involved in cell wall biosynthesis
MPYQDIAQSGAITVAYRYNLPIIMSDLPQFKPFGIDGQTGLFFESKNANDLEEKMEVVLDGGANLNNRLKKGLADFVEQRYSTKSIAKKYLHFFEELLLATNK